ncbi:MAG: UDP-N-acetylmuramyl peptide synthase [Actinobacteria bacterium]|nr:MAG: UDP-N-acetylmuramyl peptide synthase [Actinomycetota bacterium]
MIGGEVAQRLSPEVLSHLARGKRAVIVSGTNGKSTTTRMVATALARSAGVASNIYGDNMPPGIITALMTNPDAHFAALEVDELHVPIVAQAVKPAAFVFLNLSRDQLDRVGEIGTVERRLREAVSANPQAAVIANCDDPLIVSAAMDAPRVIWVAAGAGWGADSVSFPRGGRVIREGETWRVVSEEDGTELLRRPTPHWWVEDEDLSGEGAQGLLCGQFDVRVPLHLSLPGRVNLGNAAQAVAAAIAVGVYPEDAVEAVTEVAEVAGRYSTHNLDGRQVRIMLAKNPAGWQESLLMLSRDVDQVVIGVNGQVPDGQDLSWLWDVDFDVLGNRQNLRVVACGERGADLAVRLAYAGVEAELVDTPMEAVRRCDAGRVEMLLNYTSLRDFKRVIEARSNEEKATS